MRRRDRRPLPGGSPGRHLALVRVIALAAALGGPVALTAAATDPPAAAGDDPTASSLDRRRAGAAELFARGDVAGARDRFAALWEAHVQAGTDTARAALVASFDLGACHLRLGELGAARLAFERAVAGFAARGRPDELALALALEGLAATLAAQENAAAARVPLQRARTIRERHFQDDHPQLARLDALAGRIARLEGRREEALAAMERAKEAYRRIHGNVHPEVAAIVRNFADLYLAWGHPLDAELMAHQADYITREVFGPGAPERAATLAAVGRVRLHLGWHDRAEAAYREALALLDAHGRTAMRDVAVCELGLGRTLLATGRSAAAIEALHRAADAYERAWWLAGRAASRATFMASPYPVLAAAELLCGEPGSDRRAWRALERHHGRTVRHAAAMRALDETERTRRDSLRQRRVTLTRRLEQRAAAGATSDVAALRTERAEVDAALLALEERLRDRTAMTDVALGKVLAGTALLGWLDVAVRPDSRRSWAWVATADRDLRWIELPDGREVAALAASLREALGQREQLGRRERERRATIADAAARLYELRLAPLEDRLAGVDRLVVVPGEAMTGLPLATLRDADGRPVQERWAVSTVPAASGWSAPAGAEVSTVPPAGARTGARILAVADPPFNAAQRAAMAAGEVAGDDDGERGVTRSVMTGAVRGDRGQLGRLARLPATRHEVDAVGRYFAEREILVGEAAHESRLRALQERGELGRYDVVHLATHALVDADRPERSALVLSQVDLDDRDDGLLTAAEIAAGWHLDADLVVLSACETGLGRPAPGEGYLGFTQAFLAAGARSVLVSLWQVDDRATALLMERFYATLRERGLGQCEALREAQGWLRHHEVDGRRVFADERYWGAFVLVGVG
ncbi:CHAT domain-containing protein [bacterium]|nr:CHAT domain-containing protein [bacterium]